LYEHVCDCLPDYYTYFSRSYLLRNIFRRRHKQVATFYRTIEADFLAMQRCRVRRLIKDDITVLCDMEEINRQQIDSSSLQPIQSIARCNCNCFIVDPRALIFRNPRFTP